LEKHGLFTQESPEFKRLTDRAWPQSVDGRSGDKISNLKVYWTYADRRTGDKFSLSMT
jgi:hypothetical protein